MDNQKHDTIFDVGMFTVLAFVVMGYFSAIAPSVAVMNLIPFVTIPSVLAPLAPVMIAFLLVTVVGAVGTPVAKAALNMYGEKKIEDEDDEMYTYSDAERELRNTFQTTLDKNETKANITSVNSEDGQLELTFSVLSGREYTDSYSIDGDTEWSERNPVAVLFEYLEVAPPTDYRDLALADKEVYITPAKYGDNDFRIDIDKLREEMPENAFSFEQTNTLDELDREVKREQTNEKVDEEREVVLNE